MGAALEPLPPLNSGLNLAGQWKTLKPLPILSWQRCPNPNLLRGKLLEGGGILGILMMLESEANYDLILLLRDKAAADEYQLQKDLGHPPSEAERWIAQGGA